MELIIVLAALGAAGVGAMVSFLTTDLRARRKLARIARTPVAAAVEGEWVKIVGTIRRTGEPVHSPSGRACVYYHASSEHGGNTMVHVHREACAFDIEDDTGRAHVEHDGIVGVLERTSRVAVGARTRSQEAILEDGERVAVFGWASWDVEAGDGDAPYRGAGKHLVLRGTRRAPLVVSDVPRLVEH